jgi:heme/copper-type cytochrome/quinol oxidase subunit 2
MLSDIKKRGQISWLWSFTLVSIGLLFMVWMYIVLNESIRIFRASIIENTNVNLSTLQVLDGGWMFLPVLMVFSWGVYNWVIADQARGTGT